MTAETSDPPTSDSTGQQDRISNSAARRKPALPDFLILHGEDGRAMTVPEGIEPIDALIELLGQDYGGTFTRDNPALVAALADVRMQTWHSTTARWREAEGVDEEGTDWFAEHGDGRRYINVIWYLDDLYDLGDEAMKHEQEAANV